MSGPTIYTITCPHGSSGCQVFDRDRSTTNGPEADSTHTTTTRHRVTFCYCDVWFGVQSSRSDYLTTDSENRRTDYGACIHRRLFPYQSSNTGTPMWTSLLLTKFGEKGTASQQPAYCGANTYYGRCHFILVAKTMKGDDFGTIGVTYKCHRSSPIWSDPIWTLWKVVYYCRFNPLVVFRVHWTVTIAMAWITCMVIGSDRITTIGATPPKG
jgi:hypothetical protein